MIGQSKMNERLPDLIQNRMLPVVSVSPEKKVKKLQQTSNFTKIDCERSMYLHFCGLL
jgi:hypothetical protein